jgi:hypothetical protein
MESGWCCYFKKLPEKLIFFRLIKNAAVFAEAASRRQAGARRP